MPEPTDTAQPMPATMVAVIACISTYGIMLGLSWPLLSLILVDRGQSPSVIGANAAMVALGTVLASPFVPGWLRRFGARRFTFACILAEATFFLALRVFDDISAWFVIRFLMGASGSALFIASETWINDLAHDANRGRALGIYNTVISGTIALGPLILIATGSEGWLPFLTGAAFIVAASIPLLWAAQAPAIEGDVDPLATLRVLFEAPTLALGMLLMSITYTAASTLLPVYGVELGMSGDRTAVMVAVLLGGGVFLQWPSGWLCDRLLGRRAVLVLGAGGGSAFAALVPWVYVSSWVWPVVFLWGGLSLSIYTAMMTMAGDRYRGGKLAQVMAALGLLWGVGSLVGPGLGGLIMDIAGPHALPLGLALFGALYAAFAATRGSLGRETPLSN